MSDRYNKLDMLKRFAEFHTVNLLKSITPIIIIISYILNAAAIESANIRLSSHLKSLLLQFQKQQVSHTILLNTVTEVIKQ